MRLFLELFEIKKTPLKKRLTREKTSIQAFLEEQLKDQEFAESFYQGLDELRIMAKKIWIATQNQVAMAAGQ